MNLQKIYWEFGLSKILVGVMYKTQKLMKLYKSNFKRVLFSPIEKRKFSKYVFCSERDEYSTKFYLVNPNYYTFNKYNCDYYICIKYEDLIWVF